MTNPLSTSFLSSKSTASMSLNGELRFLCRSARTYERKSNTTSGFRYFIMESSPSSVSLCDQVIPNGLHATYAGCPSVGHQHADQLDIHNW